MRQQKELGESPQLDLERAEGLVNTTKSTIPEFQRQADNARLRLSVLTGEMSEVMAPLLLSSNSGVIGDIKPVLLTPAEVIARRLDVQAAEYELESRTSLTKAEIRNIFPKVTLGGYRPVFMPLERKKSKVSNSGVKRSCKESRMSKPP